MHKARGTRALALAGALLALTAAGCGSSSKSSSSSTPAAGTGASGSTTSSAPAAGPALSSAKIEIASYKFAPASIVVAKGAKVTFTNSATAQPAPHTGTANDGSFDTGTLAPGQSKTITVTKAGTIAYHCLFHAFMTATITVK